MSEGKTFNIVQAPRRSMVPMAAPPANIELASDSPTPQQSILQIIWRRRWTMLLAVLVCAGGGIAYLAKATPIYTSSARLLVEQSGPRVIATSDVLVRQSKSYLYTQCELLKSTPILSEATKLLRSRCPRSFAGGDDLLAFLKKNTEVRLGKADEIINVTLDSPCAQEAADMVNAIVESYVAYQSRQRRNTAGEILKILQREKVRRDDELKERFKAAMAFKRENEVISFGTGDSNIIIQRLDTLSSALTQAELGLMEAKARCDTTRSLLANPRGVLRIRDRLLTNKGSASLETTALEAERNRLNLELATLRHRCTDDHPAVLMIKSKLKQLGEQEEKHLQTLGMAHLAWLEQEVAAAKGRVEELNKSLQIQRELAQELNSKAVEYAMLETERKRAERICDIIDNRIKEIDITEDAGALNISLLETARSADLPSKPKKTRTMCIALALGLVLGTGLTLVREWMDHRLKSAEEVSDALGLPVLGAVPQLPGRKTFASLARMVDLEPTSLAAEAYRTIRTAVYFGSPDVQTKTLLITSPAPGDGKSTLVSNLAVAMAHAGQRVIVLDADLRKPVQHKAFEIDADGVGVTKVLVGEELLDEAIQRTGIDRLDVLPCGEIPPNPSEMLNSQAFGELLDELALRYDRVLVDAPPVLLVADANILGARCDAALLVLRAEKSSRKPSQRAVESLLSVGTRILGVVVNGVAARKRGYGYYDYGYYHHYGYYNSKQLQASTDDQNTAGDVIKSDVA